MADRARSSSVSIIVCLTVALGLTLAGTATAQGLVWTPQRACSVYGAWQAEVDIGARFFVTYSRGVDVNEGPMAVEWIAGDPTLFGSFPSAVRLTQGAGAWERINASTYRYTWISYGIDAAGVPVFAWKGSGIGTLQGCDMIVFDYVAEIFPMPLDPLMDEPVSCISGSGTKYRVSVVTAECS